MDLDSWMKSLSATNDAAKAPIKPFTALLGPDQEPYTFSSDRVIIVVAAWDPSMELHPIDALGPEEAQRGVPLRVVERAQAAQEKAVLVGCIDALSLKELVGEPEWGSEGYDRIMQGDNEAARIVDTYYSRRVLARALAAWTAPIAVVYQAEVLDRPRAKVLLLQSQEPDDGLLVICSPYWTEDGGPPASILELPEWLLVLKK